MTQIQGLSEKIGGRLDHLGNGVIDDEKIGQMQVLHGVAVACGNTWIGRSLLAMVLYCS